MNDIFQYTCTQIQYKKCDRSFVVFRFKNSIPNGVVSAQSSTAKLAPRFYVKSIVVAHP